MPRRLEVIKFAFINKLINKRWEVERGDTQETQILINWTLRLPVEDKMGQG